MIFDIYIKWKLDYSLFVQFVQFFRDSLEIQANQWNIHPTLAIQKVVLALKATCVVFMEWFLYKLVILIKLYKTRYQNLDKHKVWYFLLKFCTFFLLNNVYKRVFGIFFILFRSWVICKNKKRHGFYALVFHIFINNSRSRQNKRNPEHPFVGIIK